MEDGLNGNCIKDEVLTDIVQLLESDGTFAEIVSDILRKMEKYINTSNAEILQIGTDGKTISPIITYGKKTNESKKEEYDLAHFSLCKKKLKYVTSESCGKVDEHLMNQLGIKTCVTAPIMINNIIAMYIVIYDTQRCMEFDGEMLQFISDASKLIQCIAQKKVTQNSLLSSYEVLKNILSSIGTGIVVCNRTDGSVFFENDTARNTQEVRRTIEECIEHFFRNGKASEDIYAPVEHYDTESGLWFEIKFSNLTWIDGSNVIVCTATDITQRKKNQQKIEFQAHNDFLTGLYNRMKCENDLRKIIRKSVREGTKGAVMFIDLDDFKHINDGLGHQYGDVLLQQIAAGLQSIPGLREHCYRMGGDEFVIIVKPELYNNIERIITNIISMFNKPWYLMETEYFCTMSMGIATFPDDSTDVHEIVRMADIAMYEAKGSGKNGYAVYDENNRQNMSRRLDIENNMRQAVATGINEFVVFYQPVVDVKTQECSSCEALVRWDSKALGFLGPGDFIPLAEYLGLITSIGDYVLEEACRQCKKWNESGYPDFHINVNLSVVQLLQKDVVSNIKRVLNKTQVNPANIVLEITESFVINDMKRVLEIIEGLKQMGLRIALDDFGTGYSSLNYIKQLPFDIIKVDKTFIDDILEDDYAQAFVKLIVDLSKTIGTQIVVEGVEHKEQFDLLKKLGVNYIQGYYFGKPVPADEFERINLKRR